MAEGRVAEIVDERHRLGQILVAAQRPGQRTRDLRDLDRMGQPRAVMVALMGDEDLRLVLEPAKGRGMDDAVAVALEGRAGAAFGFRHQPAARARRIGRIDRARPVSEADVAKSRWSQLPRSPRPSRVLTWPPPLHTYDVEWKAR
jgi:hypothetical protein